jgi:hypothetical protein
VVLPAKVDPGHRRVHVDGLANVKVSRVGHMPVNDDILAHLDPQAVGPRALGVVLVELALDPGIDGHTLGARIAEIQPSVESLCIAVPHLAFFQEVVGKLVVAIILPKVHLVEVYRHPPCLMSYDPLVQ